MSDARKFRRHTTAPHPMSWPLAKSCIHFLVSLFIIIMGFLANRLIDTQFGAKDAELSKQSRALDAMQEITKTTRRNGPALHVLLRRTHTDRT
ncbi:hypothetical protein P153DRAFT_78230 [Dothidotthia symphoricarpi CBS 119687]|uniref:Uncharacterized protein n=1 Tax=Dothidotthia symphoricarpi CBS 119687 TaxID=1392245 RepID=A0A6A6A6R7_9PLEO|nr:uncharacterized protein P153DRAFT_78230 [Dothidotthia symphoricarpi CBS 119687]KAF2126468.1 hypothetical protein P153DRAFT_78230 [Dothidotthia symphoricarpi CBS 119687]